MTVTDNIKVDVIIPIYNAFEDLARCIDSIKKYMDFERHSLVLINDNSTDERVKPYLDSLGSFSDGIHIIHNNENKGFSGNVNIGMKMSENDVILLNSDTIVTKGWIGKMIDCAYSNGSIATVTPLSNNATLCSVPGFCKENDIPAGLDIDGMADLVEKVSFKKYPHLPVAHGFCMYIKRSVINEIGFFDEDTFKKGYGEENDFCYRAIQAGYVNVMCDDTFIYHKGSSSFVSDEKKKLMAEHKKILEKRYPAEIKTTSEHCAANPNRKIFNNVRLNLGLRTSRKNILYLMQKDFKEGSNNNYGGTQLHVKDLTMNLRHKYNVFVVARTRDFLNLTAYMDDDIISYEYYIGAAPRTPVFTDDRLKGIFGDILDTFGIGQVHIHHTLGLSLDMFYEAGKRNIPIIVSMHDHYFLCPNSTLMTESGCCYAKESPACPDCIKQTIKVYPAFDYLKIWRKRNLDALNMASAIIVPSESLKKTVEGVYPSLKDKLKVIEHGTDGVLTDVPGDEGKYSHKERDFRKKFNVAFIGGLSAVKGAENIYNMIKHSGKKIRWHIFGDVGHGQLEGLRQRNLVMTGKYKREELGKLFEKYEIDLVCILSICPETFCYTLSESIANKVPVLATRIGALSERMDRLECGWTVPADADYKEILAKIGEIRSKPDEYKAVMERIYATRLRSTADMARDYDAVYGQYIKEYYAETDVRNEAMGRILMDNSENGLLSANYEYLKVCEDKIRILEGMFLYRMAYKMAIRLMSINFPGKKFLVRKITGRKI